MNYKHQITHSLMPFSPCKFHGDRGQSSPTMGSPEKGGELAALGMAPALDLLLHVPPDDSQLLMENGIRLNEQ